NLKSVIRAVVNDDWQRVPFVLQMASEACTMAMRHAILNTLWEEWQQDKQIYDPIKIRDFFEQLEHRAIAPKDLLQSVYRAFVSRSAQLLSAPFYTESQGVEFPQVTSLLSKLSPSPQKYMRDILETVFDAVLALESTLSVAQHLGNFSADLSQLAMANVQLLNRRELQINSSAHTALLDNLRELVKRPGFRDGLDLSLRNKVFAQLTPEEGVFYGLKEMCLRSASNDSLYLLECIRTYQICTREQVHHITSFIVQSGTDDASNRTQFAFQRTRLGNRYMVMDQTVRNKVTKNVAASENIYWWHVVPGQEGVALYDAATSGSVICGGDPMQWNSFDNYAYTRRAQDFDAHRKECSWIVEDCNDK
ncbi:hypothetical protein KR044_002005, partial [Drosophila immigrans]